MQIHLDNTHSVGLGDYLCLLSVLCDLTEPVEVLVDDRWNTYNKLCEFQRVLNIPDYRVKFTKIHFNGSFNITGWPLKMFSSYYQPSSVNVLGHVLQTTGPSTKQFIGIAAYNGSGMWMDNDRNVIEFNHFELNNIGNKNEWPNCRYQPIDYWSDVYKYLQTKNFETIDLDGSNLSFEEKVYMMVKHCRAIIAYEGGIAHLAHVLNIPCFIVDWNLPTPSTELGDLHVEIVHQSPSMYLLRPERELLDWTHEQFHEQIMSLWNGKGNNRIVNKEVLLTYPNGIKGSLVAVDKNGRQLLKTTGSIFGDSMFELSKKCTGTRVA